MNTKRTLDLIAEYEARIEIMKAFCKGPGIESRIRDGRAARPECGWSYDETW